MAMNLRIFMPGNTSEAHKRTGFAQDLDSSSQTGAPLAELMASQQDPLFRAFQRCADVLAALAFLILFSWVFLIIAIVIKLDTPGPVLFRQRRVGKAGREFWFYKFRSMVADAEARRAALVQMNEASGPLFKIKNDPRITWSGRWLRKYSIDELPQFINVLKGDMSLVGPRPALPVEVAQYTPRQQRRLAVKPGITGLWQVSGRSDLPFDRSIDLDLEYVDRQSVWLYAKIIVMTIPAVLLGRGAY